MCLQVLPVPEIVPWEPDPCLQLAFRHELHVYDVRESAPLLYVAR